MLVRGLFGWLPLFECLGCLIKLFGVVVWCVWLFVCVGFVFVLFDLLFASWLRICFDAFVIRLFVWCWLGYWLWFGLIVCVVLLLFVFGVG